MAGGLPQVVVAMRRRGHRHRLGQASSNGSWQTARPRDMLDVGVAHAGNDGGRHNITIAACRASPDPYAPEGRPGAVDPSASSMAKPVRRRGP